MFVFSGLFCFFGYRLQMQRGFRAYCNLFTMTQSRYIFVGADKFGMLRFDLRVFKTWFLRLFAIFPALGYRRKLSHVINACCCTSLRGVSIGGGK
jgi:hypothetical protein